MKTISNMISEAANKIYVLYAEPKEGSDRYLLNRITLGVYTSSSACMKDQKKFEEALPKISGYEDYKISWYDSILNMPLVDSDMIF